MTCSFPKKGFYEGQSISRCKTLPTESNTLGTSDICPLPSVLSQERLSVLYSHSALWMGETLYPHGWATVIREYVAGQLQQDWSLGTLLGSWMRHPHWRMRETSAGELPQGSGGTCKVEEESCKALWQCWLPAKLGGRGLPQKKLFFFWVAQVVLALGITRPGFEPC